MDAISEAGQESSARRLHRDDEKRRSSDPGVGFAPLAFDLQCTGIEMDGDHGAVRQLDDCNSLCSIERENLT
jgi:hypothetical protein